MLLCFFPEFQFESETKVHSLSGLQRYKGDYVLNGCMQYLRVLVLDIKKLREYLSTLNEAKFLSIGLTSNLCNSRSVCLFSDWSIEFYIRAGHD